MLNFYHVLGSTYALSNAGFLNLSPIDILSKIIVYRQGLPYASSASGKPCRAWRMTHTVPLSLRCVLNGKGNCIVTSLLDWQL